MATSNKKLNDELRNKYLEVLKTFFNESGEEVLVTGTNEICLPCVDSEQNDKFIQIVIKVPTGSRDGDAFDGYSLAEDFKIKQDLKEQKKKEDEEKKRKLKEIKNYEKKKRNSKNREINFLPFLIDLDVIRLNKELTSHAD